MVNYRHSHRRIRLTSLLIGGGIVRRLMIAFVLAFVTIAFGGRTNAQQTTPPLELDCDPCIDRPTYTVRAIVHGTKIDAFWQRVRAASIQSGKDMRINLEFELYETFDPQQMATDIIDAATSPTPPAALVVTIPAPIVEDAIVEALKYVPIFGMNSGFEIAEQLGVFGFVAMDEYLGGQDAGREFLDLSPSNITRALYINTEKGNSALEARLEGFQQALQESSGTIQVDELVVDPSSVDLQSTIESALEGCPYEAVLLSSARITEQTTSGFYVNGCSLSDHLLATFDTDEDVYAAIATGKLSFAISQQSYLQGALSIVFAATYVTTGKKLARSGDNIYGIWRSGPRIINLRNLPSDTLQTCEASAFLICPNDTEPDGVTESKCKCTDRSEIVIGGVLHGVTTDSFWDVIFAQAHQAADDLGVVLKLDRLEPEFSDEVWHSKMASKMISLCREGIDGLFVTIPSDAVIDAIKECQALNVPIMSVNTGAKAALDLGLIHHVSQLEYSAGFGAGKRLAEAGIVEGMCLNNAAGNSALEERCKGMEAALKEEGISYLGMVMVPRDYLAAFIQNVEDAVDRPQDDDWEGIGILVLAQGVVSDILVVKEKHPKLVAATFDASNEIYDAIDDGKILFGIDQNPFIQGFMPLWLLATFAHTKQHLRNIFIETGPSFVDESPSEALQACIANDFEVCPRPMNHDMNQLTRIRPVGLTLAALALAASIFFAGWVVWNRKNTVVRKSQPIFLIMICIGTLLMASTIIPLSIDDSIATTEACTKACMAAPWLFTVGFTTAFAAVFSKIWRVYRLWKESQSFRRVKLSAKDVMLPFAILLSLNFTFLLVWTVVDPMYWDRRATFGSDDGLSSYGLCVVGRSGVSTAMLACLLVLGFFVVVLANFQVYKGRKLSTEFSESKYVAICMVCFLQVIVVGLPLVALVYTNPPAEYFVQSAIILVLVFSLLLLIFVPKMIFMKKERTSRASGNAGQSWSLRSSTASPSTSDALRVVSHHGVQHHVPRDAPGLRLQAERLGDALKDAGVQLSESVSLEDIIMRAGIPIHGPHRRYSRISFTDISPKDGFNEGATLPNEASRRTALVRFSDVSSQAVIPENGVHEEATPSTTDRSTPEDDVFQESAPSSEGGEEGQESNMEENIKS